MKKFVTILFGLLSLSAFGQVDLGSSRLMVVGTASKTIALDQLRLRFIFDIKDKTQKGVIQKMNDQREKLLGQLTNFDIKENDLSVTSLSLSEDYDYTTEKPKRIGFTASRTYELSIKYNPNDFTVFIDSIYALGLRDMRLNIDLQLSPTQKDVIDRELIRMAISDAQKSAKNIADALGISLESIYNVFYTDESSDKNGVSAPLQKKMEVTKEGGNLVVPNDQYLASRTISITWNIRKR